MGVSLSYLNDLLVMGEAIENFNALQGIVWGAKHCRFSRTLNILKFEHFTRKFNNNLLTSSVSVVIGGDLCRFGLSLPSLLSPS